MYHRKSSNECSINSQQIVSYVFKSVASGINGSCEVERSSQGQEMRKRLVERYLAIEIRLLNTTWANLSNVFILNTVFRPRIGQFNLCSLDVKVSVSLYSLIILLNNLLIEITLSHLGIELRTPALSGRRSTIELMRPHYLRLFLTVHIKNLPIYVNFLLSYIFGYYLFMYGCKIWLKQAFWTNLRLG